ncbi:PHP domain-containing protein [Halobiforma nitratireducens]|uniref:PHP domain-containing protein n=1 Tax=Halobiforma nitratireducens JCM 10879 TaxID=1227454 RepID=M0LXA5_9EURY|nr:PHP domain-containing protein [Halobiforma nitratireducens]EMA38217.1 PHP domain-containing protein [Halobiforma nitratireducens JCM 10879]
MPYADLHVHTTRSDGSLDREAVPAAARRHGVDVVALTDHDRLQPTDAPVLERDGVTIVNGIELRVEIDGHDEVRGPDDRPEPGQRVDLLGYAVERTTELEALTDRIQQDRIERGQAIVDRVEDRLGVDLGVTVTDGFGRPHVARAIDDHPDVDCDYEGAFDGLIGGGDPCYVPRNVPSFERGLKILEEAASLVALAHPLRYPDPASVLERAAALDAVELWYPYGREDVDLEPVERTLERYDLLPTGGSDAHEDRLGVAGLSREEYERLGLPTPADDEREDRTTT